MDNRMWHSYDGNLYSSVFKWQRFTFCIKFLCIQLSGTSKVNSLSAAKTDVI